MAVLISVLAILSPYYLGALFPAVVPYLSTLWADLLVVYGIPIATLALLLGAGPLRGATGHLRLATVRGFAWYGVVSVAGLFLAFVIVLVYTVIDPALLDPLSNPNPALEMASSNPWFWVVFSFVVGAVEELIFRGWIFGYWLQRRTPRWVLHAAWTSALFAGVHLYYGFTYLAASPIAFVTLFLSGFGFAATVRDSGGNLVVVALLHGAFDASAFLGLVSGPAGLALRYGVIGLGLVVAIVLYLSRSAPLFADPPGSAPPKDAGAAPAIVPPGAGMPPPPDATG